MHGFEGQLEGLDLHYSHAPVETGVAEETLRDHRRGPDAHARRTSTLHPNDRPRS